MNTLKTLQSLLSKHDKKVLTGLFILAVIVSLTETMSISALMLFISVATNFDYVLTNKYTFWLYQYLSCSSPAQFIIMIGSGLLVFYLIRGALNIGNIYLMSRFSYTRYHRFATHIFNQFLNFSYQDFTSQNSATIHQTVFHHTGMVTQLMFALLAGAAELLTVLCVYGMLFFMNWKMTLVLSLFLGIKCFLVIKLFSRSVKNAGNNAQKHNLQATKIFNESVGNFKLIKLLSSQEATFDRFSHETKGYSAAHIIYLTLQHSPRFVLETMGFVILIGIMVYVIAAYGDASFVIPMVSLYALAFYRLLPSVNKILAGFNQMTFSQKSLFGVADFFENQQEVIGNHVVSFNRSIILNNVSFGYKKESFVLDDMSLTITKGQRVAFIGPSGAGKSTLVDLLMGLYKPLKGVITIDDVILSQDNLKSWREKIGYIPQSIYLFDGTVADNVIFGRKYDTVKLIAALKKAHIYNFLQTQDGLETFVGEGGVKLSGGQKQRIAIARALYDEPELLVLDEATSALDHDTENNIMNEIYALPGDITLVIIAHRLSSVQRCDVIYNIAHGNVYPILFDQINQYQELGARI